MGTKEIKHKHVPGYIIALLLFIQLTMPLSAQTGSDSVKVTGYFKKAYGLYDKTKIQKQSLNNAEKDSLLIEYYDIMCNHFAEYKRQRDCGYNSQDSLMEATGNKFNDRDLHTAIVNIWMLLKNTYGEKFMNIISAPYVAFATVIDEEREDSLYTGSGLIPLSIYKLRIDDIIKGTQDYKKNDTVELKYVPIWFMSSNAFFEKGRSYLIAFKPWWKNARGLSIYNFEADNMIYYIQDGNIIDKNEYFEMGKTIPLNRFREEFQKKYILKGEK